MPLHVGLHKHAFWLYGVLIALAIRQALLSVIPDIFKAFLEPSGHSENLQLESARLFVFLVVTIRFFLGSVSFFEDAYEAEDADTLYPTKNYARDYIFGLIHFLFFFAWSLSIDAEQPKRLFPILLAFILFYDVPWYVAGKQYDTKRRMKLWANLNVATLLVAGFVYACARLNGQTYGVAQQWAFVPVVIVSVLDTAEIIGKKEIFKKWIGHIIDLKPQEAPRPANPPAPNPPPDLPPNPPAPPANP